MNHVEEIQDVWEKLYKNTNQVINSNPNLTKPHKIKFELKDENDDEVRILVKGFNSAVTAPRYLKSAKQTIYKLSKQLFDNVQYKDSINGEIVLVVTKELNEAAISIFSRDPKTNRIKKSFRCIGGKKHGRKVSDPKACLVVPDVNKRAKLSKSRNLKRGQINKARAKNKITNVVGKRVRKANARLKKARGR